MSSGYQDRLSDTYWTGTNLVWTGTLWTSLIAVASVELTPTVAMDLGCTEFRLWVGLTGTVQVDFYSGVTYVDSYILSGNSVEKPLIRKRAAIASTIKLLFDNLATVTIIELEVGYNGLHL